MTAAPKLKVVDHEMDVIERAANLPGGEAVAALRDEIRRQDDLHALPMWVPVFDDEESAEILRAAGETALSLEQPHVLDADLPRGKDSVALAVGKRAQRVVGDLQAAGAAETWGLSLPYGCHTFAEFIADRERVAGRRLDAADRLELWRTIELGAKLLPKSKPTGHPDAPSKNPPTAVERAFAPLQTNLLSTMPEPRQWLFRHPDRDGVRVDDRQGDGMLPLGKVGLLLSSGGVGKTMLLVEAAVAIITGRRWLGHFDVDGAVHGCVLLALAEEDLPEAHRRLFAVAEMLQLTEAERREIERRLVVLPLAGITCAVATKGATEEIRSTGVIDGLLRQMQGRTWAFIGADPLSRFSGISTDADNTAATFVITEFERLAQATGATVLIAHHTSKLSRREGQADSRGATALEDGVRWVASLRTDGDRVLFQQRKSNYSRPMPDSAAITLVRERGGLLRAEAAAETAARESDVVVREEAEIVEQMAMVVAHLTKRGSASSIDEACKGCGCKLADARVAFRRCLTDGTIKNRGSGNRPSFYVPGVGGGDTPIPPDVGTSSRLPVGRRYDAASRTTSDDADDESRRDLA